MRITTFAALALLSAPAAAESLVFTIRTSASNFTWTGTTSIGAVVGNPSNTFQLAGPTTLDLGFQTGAQPIATLAITSSDARTIPADMHGRINNPLPFLPPLALIDIVGLHLSAAAPSVSVAPNGAFTAQVTITTLSGLLNVTPITGSPTSSDLTGNTSAPTTVNGTASFAGGVLTMSAPVNTTFPFNDPTSGITGSLTLTGTLVADYALAAGFCFGDGTGTACPCGNNSTPAATAGCANSLGTGGRLVSSGLPIVGADGLVLASSGLPATATALYFQGTSQIGAGAGSVFGDGKRCAGGTVIRLGTKTSVGGASSYPEGGDLSVSVKGAVVGGTTHTYQAWYRNAAAFCSASTFNLTNGLRVTWLP